MKEKITLLCMAYPEISKKYGMGVCMAGITESQEFRRIYPIPLKTFYDFGFHKREIIEYELRDKGDYRKESYKVRPETFAHCEMVDYEDIRTICESKVTSIENLESSWQSDYTSLGIIKPRLVDIIIEEQDKSKQDYLEQQMLDGKKIRLDLPKYSVYYQFKCSNSCKKIHKCLCIDTEAVQLYRNLKKCWGDNKSAIVSRMKERLFYWMRGRDLYFMMGTHSLHPNHWMVISYLYPPSKTRPQKSIQDFN